MSAADRHDAIDPPTLTPPLLSENAKRLVAKNDSECLLLRPDDAKALLCGSQSGKRWVVFGR